MPPLSLLPASTGVLRTGLKHSTWYATLSLLGRAALIEVACWSWSVLPLNFELLGPVLPRAK